MTFRSKALPCKGPIYHHIVKVSYTKSRRDITVETWVITRYTDPVDIMMYDDWTMNRLRQKYYGNRKLKEKPIRILEVLETIVMGRQYREKDDTQGPDSSGHEQGSRAAARKE